MNCLRMLDTKTEEFALLIPLSQEQKILLISLLGEGIKRIYEKLQKL